MPEGEKFKVRDRRHKSMFKVDDEYLNGYARLCGINATGVYAALCRHADSNEECFPSQQTLSEKLGISRRSVQRAIVSLQEWGIVTYEQERQGKGKFIRNTYYLVDKSLWKPKPSDTGTHGKEKTVRHTDARVKPDRAPYSRTIRAPQGRSKDTHTFKDTHLVKDTHTAPPPADAGKGKAINDFLALFKNLNPSWERLYSNKTQRLAATRLLGKYGFDSCAGLVGAAESMRGREFAPSVSSPYELEMKLAKIKDFIDRDNSKKMDVIKVA